MKNILILLFLLPLFHTGDLYSQNWMMPRSYYDGFVGSVYNSGVTDAAAILDYQYQGFEYDPVLQEYKIILVDSMMMDEDFGGLEAFLDSADYYATIKIKLNGGEAVFNDNLTDKYRAVIADLSGDAYIFNSTDQDVTFSLSCDDLQFYPRTIKKKEFNHWGCSTYYDLYIKLDTYSGETFTGSVHYKLERGKGYKIQYDQANKKLEVYLNNGL